MTLIKCLFVFAISLRVLMISITCVKLPACDWAAARGSTLPHIATLPPVTLEWLKNMTFSLAIIDYPCEWAQNTLFSSVFNEHVPLKEKSINKPQVPYLNSGLRKAIHNSRSMYAKWKNKVVKLRKISIQSYFDRRCNTKYNSMDFYKTVGPFLSD